MDIYQGWNIATNSMSGWFCKTCGYSLSWEEAKNVGRSANQKCVCCNEKISVDMLGVKVLENDTRFFDIKNVYDSIWYHASKKNDWLDSVLDFNDPSVVHLGSLDAALARKEDYEYSNNLVNSETKDDWFLYEVRILPEAYVSNRVWEDADKSFPRTVDELLASKYAVDIVRYVNFWECPGSISLLANPRCLKLVNKRVL